MNSFALRVAASLSTMLLAATSAVAGSETILATDTGHYYQDGSSVPSNTNYPTGYCSTCGNPGEYRSFFVFDLSGYRGVPTGAKVSASRGTAESPDVSESILFREVTTSTASLLDGTAGVSGFNDLADGTLFGSTNFVVSSLTDPVLLPLTVDGIAAVRDAVGGQFALGAYMATIGLSATDEFFFGSSAGLAVNLVIDGANCPDTPASGCATAPKSSLKFKRNADPTKQSFSWKWSKGTAMPGDFGAPLSTTAYALCVYKDGVSLISDASVAGGSDWSGAPSDSPTKFKFKPETANDTGVTQLQLGEGIGKAKIQIKGKGADVVVPTLPSMATELRVQLLVDSVTGTDCWESSFSAPFAKDEATGLTAK